MTEEVQESAVSEHDNTGAPEAEVQQQVERQVPLSALEAERQKRQEREQENHRLMEQLLQQQQMLKQYQQPATQPEDEDELVNRKDLKRFEGMTREEITKVKREIAEEVFQDANPDAIKQINMHLKDILDKRPWLQQTIESAPNRYSRAYEIVQDYKAHLMPKNQKVDEAKRIVENAQKPGSPVAVGKSANASAADNMLGMRGTKEFKEYRRKLLRG